MRDETAHLRDGLDERGIFWIDIPRSDRKRTCWKSTDDQDGYCYFDEDIFGVTELMVTGISAEEVIAATLGMGVNCSKAEHDAGGCLGFQSGDDDEPVDQCKACHKYTSYEVEL